MSVHPTAVISEQAIVSPEASIGPYCVIAARVTVGAHTVVESHARIGSAFGEVSIGEHNYIQSGAVLGGPPQDVGHPHGASTRLEIGAHNRIGEYASIHLGTEKGGGATRVGDRNFIMAYAHVGHDCRLADDIVITNAAQLAGHVTVERKALISGMVAVTQFVRIGEFAFLAAGAVANKDIVPYAIAEGHWAQPRAINRVGLQRAGFDAAERRNIGRALRLLLDTRRNVNEALAEIARQCAPSPQIEHLIAFVGSSERGIARG